MEKQRSERSQLLSLGGGVLSALATSLASFSLLRRRLGIILGSAHGDDQRDVFAYVLDVHGRHAEADELRRTVRSMTYWAISDQLVCRWLVSGQQDEIEQGLRTLERLLAYASMTGSSRDLIRVNLARLRAASGDRAGALRHLAAVKHRNSGVIKARIRDDPKLSALVPVPKEVETASV